MRVLVVTDLSQAGLLSLEGLYACGPSPFGRVTVLHVIDLDLYVAGGAVPEIMEWAEGELDRAVTDLSERGFDADARLEVGPAVETIHSVAEEIGADLIVTTNLGKGAVVGRLLGSTAERLATDIHRPVLVERVAREGERWCRIGDRSPFARVLLGVDLEGDTSALIARAASVPGLEALRVVHVDDDGMAMEAAFEGLDAAVSRADLPIPVETEAVLGNPAHQLLHEAAEFDATAIAVTPCHHGVIHRGLLGSVARHVVTQADRAVLLLPPE